MSIIKNKTGAGLVEFCKAALADGAGYVYGAYGQTCSLSVREWARRNWPDANLAGGNMFTIAAKWDGKRVMDCSGLISYYLNVSGYGQNPTRRMTVHYTLAKQIAPIASLPETPGTLLWLPGHVGVYIGNGNVIEAQSTPAGVVQTRLAGRGWKKWWFNHEIDFTSNAVYNETPILNPQNYYHVAIEAPGARGRGFTTGITGSARQIYEFILLCLNSGLELPYTTLSTATTNSRVAAINQNNLVNPDAGEGYITAPVAEIRTEMTKLLARSKVLEQRLSDVLEELTELGGIIDAIH